MRLFLVLLFLIFSKVYAYSLPHNYCEQFETKEKNENINSIICFKNQEVSISSNELFELSSLLTQKTIEQIGEDFHGRLKERAIRLLIEKRKSYDGLYSEKKYISYELNNYLGRISIGRLKKKKLAVLNEIKNENQRKPPRINGEYKKDIMNLNLINSLRARSLFYENRDYKKLKQEALASRNFSNLKCENKRKKCKNGFSIFENTFKCSEEFEICSNESNNQYNETVASLDKKRKPLLDMVQTNPLLFKNKIDGSLLSLFSSDELEPSDYMKEIINEIPLELQQDYYKAKGDKSLNSFFDRRAMELSQIGDNLYKKSQNSFDQGIDNQFKEIDKMILDILTGKEKVLHHYPKLVDEVLADMMNDSKSEKDLKDNLSAQQAGLCYLFKEYPDESGMSSSAITGFVLLGVGMGLQFIPGVGNIAGAAILSARVGGTIMTIDAANDVLNNFDKLDQEVALHTAGVTTYQKLIETKGDRDLNSALFGLDAALIGLDLGALKKMKKAKLKNNMVKTNKDPEFRRYDNERRKMLDELEASHGGAEETAKVMRKYFSENEYPMSNADKIYIASMEKMIRTDLKQSIKGISESELDEKTKEILVSIAKKCLKDGK